MRRAFDLANFTAVPTHAQMGCLKAQGYTHAYVGSSFGDAADYQIARLSRGGFVVGEYMFPTRTHDTDREWWLDAELSPGTVINQTTIRDTIKAATNKPKGIYSNRTAWLNVIGFDWNVKAEFPWLKLWDANYGWTMPRPFNAFGGFVLADRIITQWSPLGLCGLNLDLNVMEDEPIAEEEDMPKVVFNTTDKKIYLVGYEKPIWITSPDEVMQLETAYGKQIALSDATIQQMHS